jgi:alpha-tubulin suppressor-like RCC1 family protein
MLDNSIFVSSISAGVAHSSAITLTGQLLMWGLNSGCQLGYSKEMKESLVPILFGGKIQVEKKQADQESNQEPLKSR